MDCEGLFFFQHGLSQEEKVENRGRKKKSFGGKWEELSQSGFKNNKQYSNGKIGKWTSEIPKANII